MHKLKCIIVEDEPLAVKVLEDYISELSFLKLEGTFKDAILATEFLRNNTVDLIFLDIHLPKLKGMAFLKTLKDPPAVIITTAYHQYAIEGYELNVTDYLLKPIEFERFLAAVNKVKTTGVENSKSQADKEFMFLSVQKRKVKILFSEIVYVESQREYIKVVTIDQVYISKMSTHEIEAILPENQFRRIHRSFIISIDKINSYSSDTVEVNGTTINIGRTYKDVINDLYS